MPFRVLHTYQIAEIFLGHLSPKKVLTLLYMMARQNAVGNLVHEQELGTETVANLSASVCMAAHSFNLALFEVSKGSWGSW